MSRLIRESVGVVVVLAVALTVQAATPSEFYVSMLRKGVAAHDAGRFEQAVTPLRVAAFGLVDSLDHYQLAHIHLALTYDRLGNPDASRESARRVVSAQRAGGRYGALQLSQETRANFEALARRSLTAADVTILQQAPKPAPTTTTAPNTTPPAAAVPTPSTTTQKPPQKQPEPAVTKPAPAPVQSQTTNKPAPSQTTTTTTTTTNPTPAVTTPAKPAPTPTRPPAPAPAPVVNVPARFTAAETALRESRLADARAIYREILDQTTLSRADLLRVAEGFYRSRDFAHALRAFERIGTLRREEQPYRYYIAVALYETGQYSRAREELAAVLPYIEETPDVARYRAKIQNAIN